MNRAHRVALVCGALPLITGISVFLLWLVTRWDWLILAGILTLYGGLAVVLVGVIALWPFSRRAFHTADLPRRRVWLSTLASLGLLLLNFPVAGGIIATVIAITTSYTVTVHNASGKPVDVRVLGGGCDVPFGSIPAGGMARRSFWIQEDGELELQAVSGNATRRETIDGYVTGNQGGDTRVTINPDGTVTVTGRG